MPVHWVDAPYEGIGSDLDYLTGTCRDEPNLFTMVGMEQENSPFGHRADTLLKAGNANHKELVSAYSMARPRLDKNDGKSRSYRRYLISCALNQNRRRSQ